jgi:transcriptional regulator with XRE-family HTH domain
MATLGQRLREEREKRGLTIEELARRTRINARYFEAIERGDTASLPGGFFYRSFIRQYARLVGLPEDAYRGEIERSLAEEAGKPYSVPDRAIDVPPLPTARRSRREEAIWWAIRAGGLVLTTAACTALYMGWERWKQSQAAGRGSGDGCVGPRSSPSPPARLRPRKRLRRLLRPRRRPPPRRRPRPPARCASLCGRPRSAG